MPLKEFFGSFFDEEERAERKCCKVKVRLRQGARNGDLDKGLIGGREADLVARPVKRVLDGNSSGLHLRWHG